MNDSIIVTIDRQISELQQARAILTGSTDAITNPEKRKRGRPKGSKNTTTVIAVKRKGATKAAGRAAVSAALKKPQTAKKRAAKKEAEVAA